MPLNIITKTTPSWRPLQPRLGKWKAKGKRTLDIATKLSVEEQFEKAELEKIAKACRYTEKLNIDMTNEGVEE